MNDKEFEKYSDMYLVIKNRLNDIQMALHYGLSNKDKAFLELVNDLLTLEKRMEE